MTKVTVEGVSSPASEGDAVINTHSQTLAAECRGMAGLLRILETIISETTEEVTFTDMLSVVKDISVEERMENDPTERQKKAGRRGKERKKGKKKLIMKFLQINLHYSKAAMGVLCWELALEN
jgi:hypothetical protein